MPLATMDVLKSYPAQKTNTRTFEIAWEVVNKVGGIYTVIKTKGAESMKQLGDNYCLIGPYKEATAKMEVEVSEPACPILQKTIAAMKEAGINIVSGRWLIDGAPQVILLDIDRAWGRIDEWKRDYFEKTSIGCPYDDKEANNSILFGYLVAWFLGEFEYQAGPKLPIVAHFHEWLAGVGLVLCRVRKLKLATVFTTHATLLGRYLCSDVSTNFYSNLPYFNVDKEAGDRGIYHRYCMERASVHCAHVFTTVSQITADESEHLLFRKCDLVLPNGLNSFKFSALHEFQNLHAKAKTKIQTFVQGHFHGHRDFNLDDTLYFFLAGRYEFRNKGADLFIESLARLNRWLIDSGSKKTVVAFIIMPAKNESYNVASLRGQAVTKRIRDTVEEIRYKVGERLFSKLSEGSMPNPDDLFDRDDKINMKRCVYTSEHAGLPPVVTHNVVNDSKDEVLTNVRRCQLFNSRSDRVKIVFHPEFVSRSSPLLPLEYEEFVRGCHLGVFPSYYEPWGYTPAECTVMGVPSITSNLSGFGCFIEKMVPDPKAFGIFIVDRRFKAPEESVNQLTEYMFDYCALSRRQRINLRNRTERLSELLGWDTLNQYYTEARKSAEIIAYPHRKSELAQQDREEFKNMASLHASPKIPSLQFNSLDNDGPPPEQFSLDNSGQ
eukprot:m.110877 g.110877  ORF g.110877 m.110877 type:complete len:663 (+) comp14050_c0_seq1:54-2042(+)